jgi:hypothetical protein
MRSGGCGRPTKELAKECPPIDKIRQECEGLPEEFCRTLRLWNVADVLCTAGHLERVMESIGWLDLIESTVF